MTFGPQNQLLCNFVKIALEVLKRGGHLAIEWPLTCKCWNDPVVCQLLAVPIWHDTRFSGCAYGLTVGQEEKGTLRYLAKPWRVMSTMPSLSQYLGRKCPGGHGHYHSPSQGRNAIISGRYPRAMCDAIHLCINALVESGPFVKRSPSDMNKVKKLYKSMCSQCITANKPMANIMADNADAAAVCANDV